MSMQMRLRTQCQVWRLAIAPIAFLAVTTGLSCASKDACATFRNSAADSLDWDQLVTKARKCLSADEFAALSREHDRYAKVHLPGLFGVNRSIQQVIDDDARAPDYERNAEEVLHLADGILFSNARPVLTTGS